MTTVAATVPDFKVPDKWNNKGNGVYLGPVAGEGLLIIEYNSENINDYLTPSDTLGIIHENNTMVFTDDENSNHGVMEVVDVDGVKYIVRIWADYQAKVDDSFLNTTMMEFNKLNNLSPVPV